MTNSILRDSFNICTNANTDGLIKCLPQPGQLRNQLFTSMLSTSIHLLNFRYHDKFCYRDKVNGAAGQRAVVMVFTEPPRQLYHDERAHVCLPGLTTLTTLSGRENPRPLTGILQKPRHRLTQMATEHTSHLSS
jgi:hypothetical protein